MGKKDGEKVTITATVLNGEDVSTVSVGTVPVKKVTKAEKNLSKKVFKLAEYPWGKAKKDSNDEGAFPVQCVITFTGDNHFAFKSTLDWTMRSQAKADALAEALVSLLEEDDD